MVLNSRVRMRNGDISECLVARKISCGEKDLQSCLRMMRRDS